MAEQTTATKTTRPAPRARSTASKKTPAKTAPVAAKEEVEETAEQKSRPVVVEFDYDTDTKSYARFKAPEGVGVTGTVYAPLGTEAVKVAFYASADSE